MIQRGRNSDSRRTISLNRPDRSPASPSVLPAKLMSWQGNPAVMIPRSGINPTARKSSPPTFVTSSNREVSGNCLDRTARAAESISTAATVFTPARSKPQEKPPIPANNSTSVKSVNRQHPSLKRGDERFDVVGVRRREIAATAIDLLREQCGDLLQIPVLG